MVAFRRSADVGGGERWGIDAKRVRVIFPEKPRPVLLGQGLQDHNLAEVVNQYATMERLLDALDWARTEPSLSGYAVERCHPTTGSSSGGGDDHDLVFVKEDAPDLKAKFEVSDVASAIDGNNKEKKDLASLGVLSRGSLQPVDAWPTGRIFLVVSEEFCGWLTRRRPKPPPYRYEHAGCTKWLLWKFSVSLLRQYRRQCSFRKPLVLNVEMSVTTGQVQTLVIRLLRRLPCRRTAC